MAKALTFIPVNNTLLVKREEAPEEEVRGGVILPSQAIVAIPKAQVLAVGDKVPRNTDGTTFVVPGDQIVLTTYGGEDIMFGTEKLTIVPWDEVKLICKLIDIPDELPLGSNLVQ